MSSFIDDINAAKDKQNNLNSEIADEILSFFKEKLDSDEFEETLKKDIIRAIKDNEKSIEWTVDFWGYQSGCSSTRFSIGRFVWHNPENPEGWDSRTYKGVDLKSISRPIVKDMLSLLLRRLEKLGLHSSYRTDESWLKNPRWRVDIFT